MTSNFDPECSICQWYPLFSKDCLDSTIVPIPSEIIKYLQHDAFLLPIEAAKDESTNSRWIDGSSDNDSNNSEETEESPSFPEFSKRIQDAIDEYGAVFFKSNWKSPSDATWIAPTKTLKCTSLEEVYLLMKSSDRIIDDLNNIEHWKSKNRPIPFCLVFKKWRDINPCTEFRCFVLNNELIGICQRDTSQFYQHIETEKYNIQRDITSFFNEKIKNRFKMKDYSIDLIRYKKDKVKIIDFGSMDESATKGTLFTVEELRSPHAEIPEFRFIAEEMGIQPTTNNHFCVPRDINEFLRNAGQSSMIDVLQREVENQNINQ